MKIWVGVLTIVLACNVIALHQWLSPKCCQDMAGCQMASHCLASGCATCAVQPGVTTTNRVLPQAKALTPELHAPEGKLVRISRDIWRPPQGKMDYS